MLVIKSFFLRLSQILSFTAFVGLLMMSATCYLQFLPDAGLAFLLWAVPFFLWTLFAQLLIRRYDPELIVEVARLLYPAGAILSLGLSIWLSIVLANTLPEPELRHLIVVFSGIGVVVFMLIRCFDIRWLRTREEIEDLIHGRD